MTMRVRAVKDGRQVSRVDHLASEEPLEIRLRSGGETRTAAVTMRTPGNDFELTAGWLYSEDLVSHRRDIARIAYCVDRRRGEQQLFNIVNVDLRPEAAAEARSLDRHFYTTSACGLCGKAGIDQLATRDCTPLGPGPRLEADDIYSLPDKLRDAQGVFDATGGLHAAALFDSSGRLIELREDVGRHNALDKLVGSALMADKLPLTDHVVMVSGRASFELVQKSVVAGVAVLCAVSAPSSLAVELARRFRMTLIGFLRGRRFNIYSSPERIVAS